MDPVNNDFWLRLDNAAKIYPAIKDRELTTVFRVAVELKERVKAKQFLDAVCMLEHRFPYFKVKLKTGFFWYYLEPGNRKIEVIPDQGPPCRAFGKDQQLLRILVKNNRISVEFSHILTDGTGALSFLKSLILVYFQNCGEELPGNITYHRPGEAASKEEYEDAYKRYFKRTGVAPPKTPRAFHPPFRLKPKPRLDVLTAIVPVNAVLEKAKEQEVSLTEYLVAVYLYSLQFIHNQQAPLRKRSARKIIRIQVPINLRRLFPSVTMRNFSLYIMPGIDLRLGHYTFEEIVKTVYHQMRLEADKKLVSKMISRNVGGEKKPFIRGLPLFIKSAILSKLYALGTRQYSGVVTNLGKIDLGQLNQLIKHFIFIPPPPNRILKVNCAVAGFGNDLVLAFGNITTSKALERQFLTFLSDQGIHVRLVSSFK